MGDDIGLFIQQSLIAFNTANRGAGVLFFSDNGDAQIQDSIIAANLSEVDGGGLQIFADGASLLVDRVAVVNNITGRHGGGIDLRGDGTVLALSNSTLSSNQSGSNGGGIALGTGGVVSTSIVHPSLRHPWLSIWPTRTTMDPVMAAGCTRVRAPCR